MRIFNKKNINLTEISENKFKLEREIQDLFEYNIKEITGLVMVKSEFVIKGKRFDTLAYDEQIKAFVIIEYKRDKNYSVIDQGMAYLKLMLENKADVILEYNEQFGKTLKRDEVEWSQSRVIFVAPSFTDDQIQCSDFKDLAIDLYEIKQYYNDLIIVNPIKKSNSAASVKTITEKMDNFKEVSAEIKVYTEEDHIKDKPPYIIELYERFRNSILGLSDEIKIVPLKYYIAFKTISNICDIEIYNKHLKIFINAKWGKISDTKNISKNMSERGHGGNGDYEIQVNSDKDLEYILSLIKQVL